MGEPNGSPGIAKLPSGFLRGLEADLRALCADARRRNPEVKEAAERVILLLKEADSAESERAAADEAASAFCAACEDLDPSVGSNVLGQQVKVALRAVSCLHKLLTHRALSSRRLSEVLGALQRLSSPPVDDNLTLKVLQGLLSLLTVRSYAKALTGDELSRAFSLLFILRTSRSSNSGNAASNALSAISQLSTGGDGGVIEQTSKAAFRQVSSDLFASAADSAVRTAVEKQAPAGSAIPLSEFPSEAQAAYSLFIDLCNAASKQDLNWLRHDSNREGSGVTGLELSLALEVLDDGLSGNIVLFGGHQQFSDLLSRKLCPVVHELLRTTKEKQTMKSLLGLVVTLVRHYWRTLKPDAEALLNTLANMSAQRNSDGQVSWGSVFAMESLRCIFRTIHNESNTLVDFVHAFDLGETEGKLVGIIIDAVCETMALAEKVTLQNLPPMPMSGSMKPFANIITNSTEFLVAIATGIYVEVIKSADEAVKSRQENVTRALLTPNITEHAIILIQRLIEDSVSLGKVTPARQYSEASLQALKVLSLTLGQVIVTASQCELESASEKALRVAATAARNMIRACKAQVGTEPNPSTRISILFNVLFDVQLKCRESLGRSWLPLIEAFEQLDALIYRSETRREASGSGSISEIATLSPKLDLIFTSTSEMSWSSCHDMISALVQCSRQTIGVLTKKSSSEDQGKQEQLSDVRVFGITRAETALLSAFGRKDKTTDAVPGKLWQLLTGHLISICTDSSIYALRKTALSSLKRVACGAVPSGDPPFIAHHKIVTPFHDLLTSSHSDVRSGALSAVYTILESQGERLYGESAWGTILRILSTAAGSDLGRPNVETAQRPSEARSSAQATTTSQGGIDTISEAFKSVQVISDNYLTFLAEASLSVWIEVLGLYCRQDEDINVALTSIGLLWRTADFFGKNTSRGDEDLLWVQLFQALKDISMDERPEVRNSAVKTLTGTLSAHSSRLSASAWNGCVAKALLPLLEEVMRGGSSGQGDDSTAHGKSRGDLQLLLHHSRDTPRKQWNETRVLALAGVAKVLRTAMPRLAILQDESGRPLFMMLTDGGTDGLWRKMLRAAGVAAGSRDREVAVAGASALLELLSAAGFVMNKQGEAGTSSGAIHLQPSASAPGSLGTEKASDQTSTSWISGVIGLSEGTDDTAEQARLASEEKARRTGDSIVMMWEAVWSAMSEAIAGRRWPDGAADGTESRDTQSVCISDEKALLMLAEGLLDIRKKLADKFTTSSSKKLIEVLMHLALGRNVEDANSKHDDNVLTPVQDKTLKGLEKLSFGSDEQSWSCLVQSLVAIVDKEATTDHQPSNVVRRVLVIIRHLYEHTNLPSAVKRSELTGVLRVMGMMMLFRDQDIRQSRVRSSTANAANGRADDQSEETSLWMEAADVVMMAMQCCKGKLTGADGDKGWAEFVKIMEEFLYSPERVRRDTEYGRILPDGEKAEKYDIEFTGCVQEALSQVGSDTAKDTMERLVGLLARGAKEGKASRRPRFVRSCQKRLFQLASVSSSDGANLLDTRSKFEDIADEANKRVVETCERVLGEYVADGHRAGRCPLPAVRRAEAVFLLQQLRKLNSSEEGVSRLSKKHLVTLYPRLCECVDSRDEAIRHLARELLDDAAPVARYGGKPELPGVGIRG